MVAVSSHHGGTRLYDVTSGKLLHVFGGHAGVTANAFSGDGKLLATGGTVRATIALVEKLGGEIAGVSVLAELSELNGRAAVGDYRVDSLIVY